MPNALFFLLPPHGFLSFFWLALLLLRCFLDQAVTGELFSFVYMALFTSLVTVKRNTSPLSISSKHESLGWDGAPWAPHSSDRVWGAPVQVSQLLQVEELPHWWPAGKSELHSASHSSSIYLFSVSIFPGAVEGSCLSSLETDWQSYHQCADC